MDVTKEFIREEEKYEAVLEDQTRCCLCGTQLKFQHKVDYLTLVVREDAHCPSCRIQLRTKDHVLQ